MTYTKRMQHLGTNVFGRLALAACVSSAVIVAAGLPARAAFGGPAEGTHFAVTTENAEATRAAMDILRQGGNAFDAAIAGALALSVTAPQTSGLGGGGFALIYSAKDRKLSALDFRETAPATANLEDLLGRKRPGAAVGTPGAPAGLEWLSVHLAKRPLNADVEPAVVLASHGFTISKHLNWMVTNMGPSLTGSPLGSLYAPGGTPLPFGTLVTNPDLAKTLRRFGSEGAKPFYSGDLAAKIIATTQAGGGTLTGTDLTSYSVKERAPLLRTFAKRTVAAMPAPSAGGLMQLELLSLFGADASSPLRSVGIGSSFAIHMLAEGMRGAIADRAHIAGDPDLDPSVDQAYEQALAPAQIAARRARIEPMKVHNAQEYKTREDGTTHLIVTDADGNVISLTLTVNAPFGARLVAGDSGIVLNDELVDFTQPSDVSGFGLVGLGPNRPRPLARPVSSMSPVIVLEGGEPIVAVGGSGGKRIATGTTQALFARLVYDLDATACVSTPRFYTGGGDLFLEPEFADDVRAGLAARGESVKEETFYRTGIQMIVWERPVTGGTVIQAASDPRKHGFAAAM